MRLLAYAWAAPYSLLGLAIGMLAVLFGARAQVREGAMEFGGGWLGGRLSRLPAPFCFSAITFGHVILGIDEATLAAARSHEQVHVRQYEHWGPFFVPAYVPGFEFEIYSASGFGKSLDQLFSGQLDRDYFPVEMHDMSAQLGSARSPKTRCASARSPSSGS